MLLSLGQSIFEVASIQPPPPQARSVGLSTFRGGRVTAENLTLLKLIQEALNVEDF